MDPDERILMKLTARRRQFSTEAGTFGYTRLQLYTFATVRSDGKPNTCYGVKDTPCSQNIKAKDKPKVVFAPIHHLLDDVALKTTKSESPENTSTLGRSVTTTQTNIYKSDEIDGQRVSNSKSCCQMYRMP